MLPTLAQPTVTIGGTSLGVTFAGLSAGQVGVYQIDANVPGFLALGVDQPLVITQAGETTRLSVRVVE